MPGPGRSRLPRTLRIAWYGPIYSTALENLRALVGLHVAVIAGQYGIKIEPDLAKILPPDTSDDDDPSFVPGWEDLP